MCTCLEREVSIKTKYGHRSIMYIIITTTNFIIKLYHITLCWGTLHGKQKNSTHTQDLSMEMHSYEREEYVYMPS